MRVDANWKKWQLLPERNRAGPVYNNMYAAWLLFCGRSLDLKRNFCKLNLRGRYMEATQHTLTLWAIGFLSKFVTDNRG